MDVTGKTVLITGGGSGIGLETARLFAARGNRVILAGRNAAKLEKAAAEIDGFYFACDVTNEKDVQEMASVIREQYGKLDILMNNAGLAFIYHLTDNQVAFANASRELTTNFLAAVNITSHFLPLLMEQPEAAIINVSSVTALTPSYILPTYSASKAALHSYSQSLRYTLAGESNIKVFEVMPSLVDTEFAKNVDTTAKLTPQEVAAATLNALERDIYEIHLGSTIALHKAFFSQADQAFKALNRIS